MMTVPKLLKQGGTARRIESLQQKMYGGGGGTLLHALNPPCSAFLFQQFLARCHPCISLIIFTLVSLIFEWSVYIHV